MIRASAQSADGWPAPHATSAHAYITPLTGLSCWARRPSVIFQNVIKPPFLLRRRLTSVTRSHRGHLRSCSGTPISYAHKLIHVVRNSAHLCCVDRRHRCMKAGFVGRAGSQTRGMSDKRAAARFVYHWVLNGPERAAGKRERGARGDVRAAHALPSPRAAGFDVCWPPRSISLQYRSNNRNCSI